MLAAEIFSSAGRGWFCRSCYWISRSLCLTTLGARIDSSAEWASWALSWLYRCCWLSPNSQWEEKRSWVVWSESGTPAVSWCSRDKAPTIFLPPLSNSAAHVFPGKNTALTKSRKDLFFLHSDFQKQVVYLIWGWVVCEEKLYNQSFLSMMCNVVSTNFSCLVILPPSNQLMVWMVIEAHLD